MVAVLCGMLVAGFAANANAAGRLMHVVSFKTEKDRDIYLEHPEHKAFVQIVGPVLDDVFVIDFQSKK
jgi:Stress responsive A/B Barrel Domain